MGFTVTFERGTGGRISTADCADIIWDGMFARLVDQHRNTTLKVGVAFIITIEPK